MIEVVGLAAAFALVLVLRIRNVDFSLSILAACAVIGVTSGKPLSIFTDSAVNTALDPTTWDLCAAVAMITVLGYVLKETGLMVDLIGQLRGFLPGKALLALIPALFGILSMPGGALMSAPFNSAEADRLKLNPEQKTFINVWFRHIWFWASPISPTTLILCRLTGVELQSYILWNIPVFLSSILIGWLVMGRFVREDAFKPSADRRLGEVLRLVSPIAVTVALTLVYVPVWASVLTGVAISCYLKRVPLGTGLGYVRKGVKMDTVLAVLSTLYFRYLITASGSVTNLFEILVRVGLPFLVVLIVAPMLVGAISGTPQMGIGIAVPILLPFLSHVNASTATIIFAGITTGYTWSPMHLCLILTNQYYCSDMNKVYRYLVPPLIVLYLFALVYHIFIGGGV